MTFSVFTPTYNRVYTLPRTYESLCAQTCKDFEWLVVDVGIYLPAVYGFSAEFCETTVAGEGSETGQLGLSLSGCHSLCVKLYYFKRCRMAKKTPRKMLTVLVVEPGSLW